MPTYIIKPKRDVDRYVAWSTIVDGPLAHGDQTSLAEWLTRWEGPEAGVDERFARADANGTSLLDREDGWAQDRFLVLNGGRSHGLLRRENMLAWLDAGIPNDMLEPLEDSQEAT